MKRTTRKIITCPRCGLLLGVHRARPYVDCPGCLGTISLFYDRPVAVVAPQGRGLELEESAVINPALKGGAF